MSAHKQAHALNAIDHSVGTTPGAGEHNIVGTSDAPAIVELLVEAPGASAAVAAIVRRAADGHIAVPTSGQADSEVLSQGQVIALIAVGLFRAPAHSFVADHTASTVGDTTPIAPQTSDPALAVDDVVVNTTDDKLYTVTSIAGGTTGDLVTYDAGVTPDTAEFRTDESTDRQWVFDGDALIWIDTGSSSHTQLHSMTSVADHSANNWKLHHSNGAGQVIELALGAAGAPLIGGGTAAAPTFGALLLAAAKVSAAGADPIDSDVSGQADETFGIIQGTGGNVHLWFKNSSDTFYVELTAI